jgi:Zn finger protein HypA/HybF involved in hydrogenase expression
MESLETIVEELVRGLREQLPPTGFRLDGIEVHLGAEVELEPQELSSALGLALPGVEIKIKVIASLLHCMDCGADYPPDEFPCPVCGSAAAEHRHGQELEIARAWGQTV